MSGDQVVQNGELEIGAVSKHDDFFDDPPATKVHAESENAEEEVKMANGEVEKHETNGEVANVNNEEQNKEPEKEGGAQETEPAESQQAESQQGPTAEAEVEQKPEAEHTENENKPERGNEETQEAKTDEQTEESTDIKVEEEKEENVEEHTEPTTEAAPVEGEKETPNEGQADMHALETGEGERRQPSGQSDYTDDFSATSDAGAGETAAEGAAAPPAESQDVAAAAESQDDAAASEAAGGADENEAQTATSESGLQDGGDPQQSDCVVPEDDKRSDSRAEAAAVVPIPVMAEIMKTDGRSTPGLDEQEEFNRGEDRTEEPAPEGSEDCRGQGQWKSEEQQAIAAAIMVQRSEKELLEEVEQNRDRLQREGDELRERISALEGELDKKNDQIVVDREILARREKELAEIRSEHDSLKERSLGQEEIDQRIKDLQERLAILARENEEKDRRIFKLEGDLRDTQAKLRDTEVKLFASESAVASAQQAPQSKTCIIM